MNAHTTNQPADEHDVAGFGLLSSPIGTALGLVIMPDPGFRRRPEVSWQPPPNQGAR